jgi:hypothetical protein
MRVIIWQGALFTSNWEGRYSSIMASKHANGNRVSHVGIEILTATFLKSSIFRDITPRSLCSPRCAYCLHHSGFSLGLLFSFDRWGRVFLRNIN